MNSYNVGQKVTFLNERGGGTIVAVLGDNISVEDDTGFVRTFSPKEIAPIVSEVYRDIDSEELYRKIEGSEESGNNKVSKVSGKRKPIEVWELDLHSHEVLDRNAELSNSEILRRQMSAFRTTFRNARNQGIRKLIVIHGVGKGVLKFEIHQFLKEQDAISYQDADYKEYGKGATEISIFQ